MSEKYVWPYVRHGKIRAVSPTNVQPVEVPRGARFVRIFNSASALSGGYDELSYNPNAVVPDTPSNRGRFSATLKDKFGAIYLADLGAGGLGEHVAITEMVNFNDLTRRDGEKYTQILPELVQDLSFAYLEVTKAFEVVPVSSERDVRNLQSNMFSIRSGNYKLTREWARLIRECVPSAKGIRFTPTRHGSDADGHAYVLFQDRVPRDCLRAFQRPVRCLDDDGYEIFWRNKDLTGFVPGW